LPCLFFLKFFAVGDECVSRTIQKGKCFSICPQLSGAGTDFLNVYVNSLIDQFQGIAETPFSLYAASLGLQFQLLILTVLLFCGTLTLFYVFFNEVHDELSEIPSVFGVND
jgi:hypothetical protein